MQAEADKALMPPPPPPTPKIMLSIETNKQKEPTSLAKNMLQQDTQWTNSPSQPKGPGLYGAFVRGAYPANMVNQEGGLTAIASDFYAKYAYAQSSDTTSDVGGNVTSVKGSELTKIDKTKTDTPASSSGSTGTVSSPFWMYGSQSYESPLQGCSGIPKETVKSKQWSSSKTRDVNKNSQKPSSKSKKSSNKNDKNEDYQFISWSSPSFVVPIDATSTPPPRRLSSATSGKTKSDWNKGTTSQKDAKKPHQGRLLQGVGSIISNRPEFNSSSDRVHPNRLESQSTNEQTELKDGKSSKDDVVDQEFQEKMFKKVFNDGSSVQDQLETIRKMGIKDEISPDFVKNWGCAICKHQLGTCMGYALHIAGYKHRNRVKWLSSKAGEALRNTLRGELARPYEEEEEQQVQIDGNKVGKSSGSKTSSHDKGTYQKGHHKFCCDICGLTFKRQTDKLGHLQMPNHAKRKSDLISLFGKKWQDCYWYNLTEPPTDLINQEPVGLDYIVPISGFYCKLCCQFYNNEITAKNVHAREFHHQYKFEEDKRNPVSKALNFEQLSGTEMQQVIESNVQQDTNKDDITPQDMEIVSISDTEEGELSDSEVPSRQQLSVTISGYGAKEDDQTRNEDRRELRRRRDMEKEGRRRGRDIKRDQKRREDDRKNRDEREKQRKKEKELERERDSIRRKRRELEDEEKRKKQEIENLMRQKEEMEEVAEIANLERLRDQKIEEMRILQMQTSLELQKREEMAKVALLKHKEEVELKRLKELEMRRLEEEEKLKYIKDQELMAIQLQAKEELMREQQMQEKQIEMQWQEEEMKEKFRLELLEQEQALLGEVERKREYEQQQIQQHQEMGRHIREQATFVKEKWMGEVDEQLQISREQLGQPYQQLSSTGMPVDMRHQMITGDIESQSILMGKQNLKLDIPDQEKVLLSKGLLDQGLPMGQVQLHQQQEMERQRREQARLVGYPNPDTEMWMGKVDEQIQISREQLGQPYQQKPNLELEILEQEKVFRTKELLDQGLPMGQVKLILEREILEREIRMHEILQKRKVEKESQRHMSSPMNHRRNDQGKVGKQDQSNKQPSVVQGKARRRQRPNKNNSQTNNSVVRPSPNNKQQSNKKTVSNAGSSDSRSLSPDFSESSWLTESKRKRPAVDVNQRGISGEQPVVKFRRLKARLPPPVVEGDLEGEFGDTEEAFKLLVDG